MGRFEMPKIGVSWLDAREPTEPRHLIPLSSRAEDSHVEVTIQEFQIAIELLAENAEVSLDQFWPEVRKRRTAQLDAYHHAEAEKNRIERERRDQTARWIEEVDDEPLRNSLVSLEAGGVMDVKDFKCGRCKQPLLTGKNGAAFVRAHLRYRGLLRHSKQDLIDQARAELADGRTSYAQTCGECHETTGYFRLIPK